MDGYESIGGLSISHPTETQVMSTVLVPYLTKGENVWWAYPRLRFTVDAFQIELGVSCRTDIFYFIYPSTYLSRLFFFSHFPGHSESARMRRSYLCRWFLYRTVLYAVHRYHKSFRRVLHSNCIAGIQHSAKPKSRRCGAVLHKSPSLGT